MGRPQLLTGLQLDESRDETILAAHSIGTQTAQQPMKRASRPASNEGYSMAGSANGRRWCTKTDCTAAGVGCHRALASGSDKSGFRDEQEGACDMLQSRLAFPFNATS